MKQKLGYNHLVNEAEKYYKKLGYKVIHSPADNFLLPINVQLLTDKRTMYPYPFSTVCGFSKKKVGSLFKHVIYKDTETLLNLLGESIFKKISLCSAASGGGIPDMFVYSPHSKNDFFFVEIKREKEQFKTSQKCFISLLTNDIQVKRLRLLKRRNITFEEKDIKPTEMGWNHLREKRRLYKEYTYREYTRSMVMADIKTIKEVKTRFKSRVEMQRIVFKQIIQFYRALSKYPIKERNKLLFLLFSCEHVIKNMSIYNKKIKLLTNVTSKEKRGIQALYPLISEEVNLGAQWWQPFAHYDDQHSPIWHLIRKQRELIEGRLNREEWWRQFIEDEVLNTHRKNLLRKV